MINENSKGDTNPLRFEELLDLLSKGLLTPAHLEMYLKIFKESFNNGKTEESILNHYIGTVEKLFEAVLELNVDEDKRNEYLQMIKNYQEKIEKIMEDNKEEKEKKRKAGLQIISIVGAVIGTVSLALATKNGSKKMIEEVIGAIKK